MSTTKCIHSISPESPSHAEEVVKGAIPEPGEESRPGLTQDGRKKSMQEAIALSIDHNRKKEATKVRLQRGNDYQSMPLSLRHTAITIEERQW